ARHRFSSPVSSATAHSQKQPALAAQRPNPAKLREPSLDSPVVRCRIEQSARLAAQDGARIGAHVLDVVRRKPGLDGGERMPVLLGMAVLIAEPRLVPRWLLPALPEHRI